MRASSVAHVDLRLLQQHCKFGCQSTRGGRMRSRDAHQKVLDNENGALTNNKAY